MTLNDVPQSGQTLGQTQPTIRANFQSIDMAFLENHVPYNETNAGMHNLVSFPPQGTPPVALAGIPQIYSQTSAITLQPELVFLRQMGATGPSPIEFTAAAQTQQGWTRLPSGILLKWNQGIGFGGGSITNVPLNGTVPASPNFTLVLNVQVTMTDTSGNYNNVIGIGTFPISGNNFTLTVVAMNGRITPGSVTFGYLAIGI
jgi:hypothetical protein